MARISEVDNNFNRQCELAAVAIKNANILLIGAGAGMSADAGLPVFSSISNTPIFQKLGLSYDQVACPSMLVKDPSLFYGFEVSSGELYRITEPHEGYKILNKWKQHITSDNTFTDELINRQKVELNTEKCI